MEFDQRVGAHQVERQPKIKCRRYRVRIGAAGKDFAVPIINLFTIRDGLITADDGGFDNGGRKCAP
jgi:hypothetical protein